MANAPAQENERIAAALELIADSQISVRDQLLITNRLLADILASLPQRALPKLPLPQQLQRLTNPFDNVHNYRKVRGE